MNRQETQSQFLRHLRQYRVSLLDYWIISELYFHSHMKASLLVERVVHTATDAHKPRKCDGSSVIQRLGLLRERGFIQRVDCNTLAAIRILLKSAGVTNVGGWPRPGHIDLTVTGAKVMNALCAALHPQDASQKDAVYYTHDGKGRGYAYSNSKNELQRCGDINPEIDPVGATKACGAWCGRWWDVFPTGFRREIRRKARLGRKLE